jgi:hypothetical protein
MNNTNPKATWDIPHVIEILESAIPVKHQEFISKPSCLSYSSNGVSPAPSEVTQQDLEDMKQMVKDMKGMPVSTILARFGLMNSCDDDVRNGFVRRVSVDINSTRPGSNAAR